MGYVEPGELPPTGQGVEAEGMSQSFQNSRGEHSPAMLFLLFAGIPCISHAFCAADMALGIFFQSRQLREEKHERD